MSATAAASPFSLGVRWIVCSIRVVVVQVDHLPLAATVVGPLPTLLLNVNEAGHLLKHLFDVVSGVSRRLEQFRVVGPGQGLAHLPRYLAINLLVHLKSY